MYYRFPACSVIKTAVQALYNSLKDGVDANMQQFQAIQPPVKTGFEQKYVICLLLSTVMNTWRAQRLLQQPVDPDHTFFPFIQETVGKPMCQLEGFQLQTGNGFDSELSRSLLSKYLGGSYEQNSECSME
jgi:hypothetical protein